MTPLRFTLRLALLSGCGALLIPPAGAQQFAIDWFTIDGGGGLNKTGARFSLDGTFGQADASGPLVGQRFTVVGGFWAGIAPPGGLLGDMNCDGIVSVSDIAGFVLALTDPAGYAAAFPDCDINNADINGDGFVTVSDIGPFVLLLTGG